MEQFVTKIIGVFKKKREKKKLHFQRLPLQWDNIHVFYKIKRKFTFILVNTKYISSNVLKTLKFLHVLHIRENSDVYNTLAEIYVLFTSVYYLQRPQPSTQLPKVKEESPTKIAVGEVSDTIAGKMSQYN